MKKMRNKRDDRPWADYSKIYRIMRLICFFMFVALIQVSASTYSQNAKLNLSGRNLTIEQVLSKIEDQSDYSFFYNVKEVDLSKLVDLDVKNKSIEEVLNLLTEGTDMTYTINNKLIIIHKNQNTSFTTLGAQQKLTVSGKVTNAEGESIPGATIAVKGTAVGTITDFDGNYSLKDVPADATLVYSFVGMKSQEIAVAGKNTIDVVLAEETIGLDEVVAIGYGVQRKSLVTGAISSVKSEELQSTASSRADQAIQGRTSGVSVLANSGSPGAGVKIRIRGTNSNGNSNPLFIVDGMKTGDINNIDPSDIESIEVLKDAASAAIYGTEGANGVIIITTKSGKGDNAKISYDFQYGLQSSRSNMKLMNASQYQTWMQESGAGTVNLDGTDTNWMDEVFGVAPMQKHHLSYSSGNDKTSYMISGSYFSQDGIVGGDKAKYERVTARANVKSNVKKWLEVGTNMSFAHSKKKYIGEDDEYRSVVNNTLLIDPLTPVTYSGTPDNVQSLLDQGYNMMKNGNGDYYGLAKYVTGETTNPLALLQTYHNDILEDKILGTVYATIKPFKGFSFTSRVGLDLTYQIQHSWAPTYYFSSENQNTMATVDDNVQKWYTWLWENFASYNVAFGEHKLTFLAGYSSQQYQHPNFTLHSGPLSAEGDQYAYQDYSTSSEFDRVGGTYVDETMTSYFGRASYSYMDKYMLEMSLRRDAASVFPTNNRAAYFPALSAGWVLSQENFFNVEGISYLKLRGSWGENGSKANLPGNEDQEFWILSGIQYPDANDVLQSGAEIDKLVNKDLRWERTQQLDIGLDLRLFDSKLSFSADYYNKITKDLIVVGTGPLSVGNEYPFVNGGDVTNKGLDFELGYRNYDHELKYSVNVNASTQDNNVSKLAVDAPVSGDNLRGYNLTWFEQGYPIWYFKGYKTNGIDPATGDPIIVDTDKDGKITAADQTYIGDPHANLLYGATINLEYKNFDFNLFVQGTQGNDVFMGWFRSDRPFSNKPEFMYNDRWTSSNTNASMPAANNTSDYIYRSDLMVSNGSYLRLKQIQLGYNIPKNLTQNVGINQARLYVSLDDYFTFTKYKGLDPEAGSSTDNRQGVDRGIYPISGKVLFGISVNF